MTLTEQRGTLVNGEWVEIIGVSDRGLAYGDGLFETMRYQRGRIALLPYHLERLFLGCTRLRIPLSDKLLEDSLAAVTGRLSNLREASALIKLIVTRGSGGRGYAPPWPDETHPSIILQFRPLPPEDAPPSGVVLQPCRSRIFPNPLLAGIKHLNRLDYVLAAQELPEDHGVQGLLFDPQARLLECLHHNLFLVADGRLRTPRLQDAGVHGVMRRYLLEQLAPAMAIEALAEDLVLEDLLSADEVFICNSVRGIWPVASCGDRRWLSPGDMTLRLRAELERILDESVT